MKIDQNLENRSSVMGKAAKTGVPFNTDFPQNSLAERYEVLTQVFYLTDEELDWLKSLARQPLKDSAKGSPGGGVNT